MRPPPLLSCFAPELALSRKSLVAAVAAIAAVVLGAAFADAAPPANRERLRLRTDLASRIASAEVVMFGDSIAFQAGPPELCGLEVFNAAIPGNRIDDLLASAPAIARRIEPHAVVVAVGANDARHPHADLAAFEAKYRRLLRALSPTRLILVEINPVDRARNAFTAAYDTAFIPRQNAVIRALAREFRAKVVPAPRLAPTRDGIHPTKAGEDLWRARLITTACSRRAAGTAPVGTAVP